MGRHYYTQFQKREKKRGRLSILKKYFKRRFWLVNLANLSLVEPSIYRAFDWREVNVQLRDLLQR